MAVHVRIVPLTPAHQDDRRTIHEAFVDVGVTVRESVLAVHGNGELGNHYHARLTEVFLLASGEADLTIQEVDGGGRPTGEARSERLIAPIVVVVPPFVAHRFSFPAPAILCCRANRRFEPDDVIPFAFAR